MHETVASVSFYLTVLSDRPCEGAVIDTWLRETTWSRNVPYSYIRLNARAGRGSTILMGIPRGPAMWFFTGLAPLENGGVVGSGYILERKP